MTDYVYGSGNPNIGTVQTEAYLNRIESLPYRQVAFMALGETIDIPENEAETHTMRSLDEISIEGGLLTPLNESVLNAERIGSVKGSVIIMRPSVYGLTLIISEKTRVNTPENIITAVSVLLSDYEMRLKERIIYNALENANLIEYVFTQGGTTSPKKANINDLIDAGILMEENSVRPIISFVKASPDEYTRPVPDRYALITSIKGSAAFKKNLNSTEFTQTHRFAGMDSYGFECKGAIERANVGLFASCEIPNGSSNEREGFLFGAQPFYQTGRTGLNSFLRVRPASESAYGMHTKVEKRTTYGVALSQQNRIMKIAFTD